MSSELVLSIIVCYFLLLITVSYFTSRNTNNEAFFNGNKSSPWFVVAFGMIGASLSGVTFLSVPGWVGSTQFSYMQMVIGYFFGYLFIANVLMPIYYKLNLISIYEYFKSRFGFYSYKTGAACFLISRVIGASFRLFLVASVLQSIMFDAWGIPFYINVLITILLIWVYTNKGGIKTIVWTDTLQTLFMLVSVGATIIYIKNKLGFDFNTLIETIQNSSYSKIFFFEDWTDNKHFIKQFFTGVFIAIVMTGMDQDMMQKNLTCKNINDAKKNMYVFSLILIVVNLIFLSLGALLYIFSTKNGIMIPEKTDLLFSTLAINHFDTWIGILFIIGLTAAAYSSADSALTSLTTSICVDFLAISNKPIEKQKTIRKMTHIFVSLLLFIVIMIFSLVNNEAVISSLFKVAGFTYGPLLGMFTFGIFTKYKINDQLMPILAITAVLFSVLVYFNFKIGFEILIINGFFTFILMFILSLSNKTLGNTK